MDFWKQFKPGFTILAPMEGVTDIAFRQVIAKAARPEIFYTEFTNVNSYSSEKGRHNALERLQYEPAEQPIIAQIWGTRPEMIIETANAVRELGYKAVDLNMGCPVPKVTNTGAGSALMKNPKLCGDIVRAIKSVTDKPVTAKIRLGWDNNSINFLEVIKELEDAGVDMIAIHSRTRKELYAGEPHHELLKGLRSKMSVPLVISGNIYTLDDAINAMEITGADAVMVARGGIGNPYLLKQINQYFKDGTRLESPSLKEQLKWCKELGEMIVEEKGEFTGMRVYRAIAPKFILGIPNAKKYKVRLCTELETIDSLNHILKDIAEENEIEF